MTITLGEVATYINGFAFKPEDRGQAGLPIIRIQDLTGNSYDLGFYDGEYPKKIEINDGDILISWSASLGVYVWNRGKALLNQHIFKVVFDKKPINRNYFVYAVQHALNSMASKTHGATMKHIIKKDFDATAIPYPTLDEQKKIASCLLRVDTIIQRRQQQLSALDNLIKARFVEMFGNPFDTSSMAEWPIKTISDLAESISDGSNVDKVLYKENGEVLFLRIQNVWCNEFRLNDSVFISEEENEVYKDTSLKRGDLLITKIGRYYTADSSLGRVAVYLGEDNKANYSNNIMRVRFGDGVNSEFVSVLMNLDDYNKYIRRTSVGGTDKRALSKGLIASYPIVLPSIDKQNEFVDFIHQVDKSKSAIQKSLDKTQILFESLMQKYFG